MKLSKALSEKNRLARKIREIQNKIESHNSYINGNTPVFAIQELLKQLNSTITELTELKTKIHNANQPVLYKIFKLAELKPFAVFLRKLKIRRTWKNQHIESCPTSADLIYFPNRIKVN